MTNAPADFTCDTLLRKRIEKLRRKEKDVPFAPPGPRKENEPRVLG
jgi:hypothetical protein